MILRFLIVRYPKVCTRGLFTRFFGRLFCFYCATATGSRISLLSLTPNRGAHSAKFFLLSLRQKL